MSSAFVPARCRRRHRRPSPTRKLLGFLHLRFLRSFLRGCSPLISVVRFLILRSYVCARAHPSREILADAAVFSGSDLRHRVNNTTQSRGAREEEYSDKLPRGKKLTRPRLLIRAYVTVDFYRAPRCFLLFLLCSLLPYLRYTIIHSVRENVKILRNRLRARIDTTRMENQSFRAN